MKLLCTCFLLFVLTNTYSQQTDTITNLPLQEIIVRAFEQNRKLKDVPAAVGYINQQTLQRFSPNAVVYAVNTIAGVRMEERSPGSYRLNIRGSSLRSPFGVRNIKVYYNDLPFTDPGGNTYLNSLGYYNYHSIEIIKGPGSSLYGAGTGGVLLIEALNRNEQPNAVAEYTRGSFGLQNLFASVTVGASESRQKISFQHQASEGYRVQSALKRNILSWNGSFGASSKGLLKTTFLYSDLSYGTPGALTKAEFNANPRMARPAGGGFPGAEQAKATIYQKTFLAGASYTHPFSASFSNTSAVYGMFTELRNPTVRNYSKSEEPHVGGRTSFTFQHKGLTLISGGEWQQNFSSVATYKNKNGEPDTLQSLDDFPVRQASLFLQAGYEFQGWELIAGGSLNFLRTRFQRTAPLPSATQQQDINHEFAPRISLSRKWKNWTVYSSIAKGFSPPTSAELVPSGSAINLSLQPEKGTNYELGFRGKWKDLTVDVNGFFFRLKNTIVQRRDAGGGDYFINAGKTNQHGLETMLSIPLPKSLSFLRQSQAWLSHTYHHFRYAEFKQLTNDFSGKRLPGVAPHNISTGIDLTTRNGLLGSFSYYFSDKIPLNDANSEYAASHGLLHAKIGYEKLLASKLRATLVVGAENLLNEKYSLGNDINGFGGRYYNAAPGRSFYTSLTLQLLTKQ